ncbi:MAG: hypothetical protein J8272_01030 ['Prunus persica' phytoplasma PP2]|nr:hypothetical protein ['Prunus persica' phytoplasma PP2]
MLSQNTNTHRVSLCLSVCLSLSLSLSLSLPSFFIFFLHSLRMIWQ